MADFITSSSHTVALIHSLRKWFRDVEAPEIRPSGTELGWEPREYCGTFPRHCVPQPPEKVGLGCGHLLSCPLAGKACSPQSLNPGHLGHPPWGNGVLATKSQAEGKPGRESWSLLIWRLDLLAFVVVLAALGCTCGFERWPKWEARVLLNLLLDVTEEAFVLQERSADRISSRG